MVGPVLALFVVVLGVVAVVAGARLAVEPTERRLALLRPLTTASICASVSATSAGVMTALKVAAGGAAAGSGTQANAIAEALLLRGLAESAVPAAAGFALLAVAWLLAAIGLRRQV